MAGTVSLSGIGGSGLDTQGLVSALVNVERQGQTALQSKLTATNSSISNLSSVSSLLAKLKSASDALDTAAEVGSYKASSSGAAIVASASGLATPGKYSLTVEKLAKEQRTYSNSISSVGTAMNQAGTLRLGVGTGDPKDITVATTDTIDDVIGKINSAGLRISASSFFDGSSYRIQLRGMDTGEANAVAITELGTSFGFDVPENTVQKAQDAKLQLDGFSIKSSTNQVTGAIRGVTLALTAESATPVTVAVDNDPDSLKTKLNTLVDTYNQVISKVKELAGSGGNKPRDAMLAGDSTLRSITQRLSSALQTQIGSGQYSTLGSVGLALDRSGKLSLDATKFDKAVAADSATVTKLFSGVDGGAQGVMDVVSSAVDAFTRTGTGLLATRSDSLTSSVKRYQTRIDREDVRINRYAEMLRKQFTAMDTKVSGYNSQASYLSQNL
ncbi:MAG: Flagellar hook-associated protein FliD [Polyangiaceae bacterium]|jgi:flagellar hook-associated protein 2|nr:Flagellar hook-associated protein FliD [Polyangiaceae bacterium]